MHRPGANATAEPKGRQWGEWAKARGFESKRNASRCNVFSFLAVGCCSCHLTAGRLKQSISSFIDPAVTAAEIIFDTLVSGVLFLTGPCAYVPVYARGVCSGSRPAGPCTDTPTGWGSIFTLCSEGNKNTFFSFAFFSYGSSRIY